MKFRVADPARDAERVAQIYRPYVDGSIISFEATAPTPAEMRARITHVLEWAPWIVASEDDERVLGYAYASRHRDRAGYRWSVDLTVYVDNEFRGRGLGRALYAELLPTLRQQRFINAYAGVGLPNDASVALHRSIGMAHIGTYEKVGWKLDRWVDVAWYGMRLNEPGAEGKAPAEPIAFAELEP